MTDMNDMNQYVIVFNYESRKVQKETQNAGLHRLLWFQSRNMVQKFLDHAIFWSLQDRHLHPGGHHLGEHSRNKFSLRPSAFTKKAEKDRKWTKQKETLKDPYGMFHLNLQNPSSECTVFGEKAKGTNATISHQHHW